MDIDMKKYILEQFEKKSKKTMIDHDYDDLSQDLSRFYRKQNKNFPKIFLKEYRVIKNDDNKYIEINLNHLDQQSIISFLNNKSRLNSKQMFTNPSKIVLYVRSNIFKDPKLASESILKIIDNYNEIFKNIDNDIKNLINNEIGSAGMRLMETTKLYKMIILLIQNMVIFDANNIDIRRYNRETNLLFKLFKNLFNKNIKNNNDIKSLKNIINIINTKSNNSYKVSYKDFINDIEKIKIGKLNKEIKESIEFVCNDFIEPENYKLEFKTFKKLKKIPADLVAYVIIEGENIKDGNDKAMIISYAFSYIERIDWYIELLDTGDTRYIVPHTKQYLTTTRLQLMNAIQNIMKIKPEQRPLIDIRYPKNYEY